MVSEGCEEIAVQDLSRSSSDEELLGAQYRVLRTIGQGSFGHVKLAKHLLTDALVAVKVLEKRDNPFITSEVDIMKSVDHPNVVKLFHVMETEERVYLVMEYPGGGDLLRHVLQVLKLQEEEARPVFRQIVSAMHYCHESGIAHRDLKLENVLLDTRGTVKVCDFGLGTRVMLGEELDKACGTLPFWAPELFQQQSYDGHKVDVWSLGVLLYCMVVGYLPFRAGTWGKLQKQVLSGRCRIPPHISPELQNLLTQLLTVDPERRPTLEQVLGHRWLRQMEPASPQPSRTPPEQPDASIIRVMTYLGYNPEEVRDALLGRTFNAAMGTYLILLQQRDQEDWGRSCHGRHPLPGPPPCPSPVDPSFSIVLPKTVSAPACHPATFLPAKHERLEGSRKYIKSASAPSISGVPFTRGAKREMEPAAVEPSLPSGQARV
ncbi:PREDICTED: sperm motility kinase X-like [Dipodomys ordii]|uniref:non-specific serine/threonine protein kinase n=1 Tax=Dipodomys ordii TaxID=10020 RepID=A0A1S3GNY7_DIPOR|nr:PREDICTED: sperm motility kinase X-like [Dipodomys ordii]